jgi:hypothetical protein
VAFSRASIAAELVCRLIELDEPADKQVETSIIVIVEPQGTRGLARRADARLERDVGKCAIAVAKSEYDCKAMFRVLIILTMLAWNYT